MMLALPIAILLCAFLAVLWLNHHYRDEPHCTCWTGNHLCELHPPKGMRR